MTRLIASAIAFFSLAALACPPLDINGLKKLIQERGETKLMFFSTWCSSCKEHLKQVNDKSILIAAFDKPERAKETLEKMNIKTPCYFDKGLTKFFGIKKVPADRVVNQNFFDKRKL